MESIAICITTRNRPNVLINSLVNWDKFSPVNSEYFIVDDASDYPRVHSDYRFETQQGIAKAKNKCLELAQGFDHVFLVDDDVYPKVARWEKPYIESGMNHLALTFEKNSKGEYYSPSVRKTGTFNSLNTYTYPNGCFLYLTKKAIEKVGGMRPEFGIWGYEHVEYSQRIHDLGLTPHPFMDVPNSLDLIHVCDYYGEVKSCVSQFEKIRSIPVNKKVLDENKGKAEFVPFC